MARQRKPMDPWAGGVTAVTAAKRAEVDEWPPFAGRTEQELRAEGLPEHLIEEIGVAFDREWAVAEDRAQTDAGRELADMGRWIGAAVRDRVNGRKGDFRKHLDREDLTQEAWGKVLNSGYDRHAPAGQKATFVKRVVDGLGFDVGKRNQSRSRTEVSVGDRYEQLDGSLR